MLVILKNCPMLFRVTQVCMENQGYMDEKENG